MKKKLFITIIVVALVLLVPISKALKENKTVKEQETEEYKEEIDQNIETKTIDNDIFKMDIPNDWTYEELSQKEHYKYALKLYKNDENKSAILYYFNEIFTVCGTGRINDELTLNNKEKASIGYYYGDNEWSDISFYELNPNIAIINEGLENEEAEEVLDFVKTITIKEKKQIN